MTRALDARLEHVQQLLLVLGEDACARDVAEARRTLQSQAELLKDVPRVYTCVATDEIGMADGGG